MKIRNYEEVPDEDCVTSDDLIKVFGTPWKRTPMSDRWDLWEFPFHKVTTVMVGAGLWVVMEIDEKT